MEQGFQPNKIRHVCAKCKSEVCICSGNDYRPQPELGDIRFLLARCDPENVKFVLDLNLPLLFSPGWYSLILSGLYKACTAYSYQDGSKPPVPVGTIVWTMEKDLRVHILALAVSYGYRRKGIARRLFEVAAKASGGIVAKLYVKTENSAAMGLYKSLGFKEVLRFPFHYSSLPNVHAIIMRKVLRTSERPPPFFKSCFKK